MIRALLLLALFLLAAPLAAQTPLSDKQVRQRLDFALSQTANQITAAQATLAHLTITRAEIHRRIVRDSLAALTPVDTVTPPPPPPDTTTPPPPPPPPPPAGTVVFFSDWSTATGNTSAAISDGGKWSERFCVGGSGVLIRVAAKSSIAGLPAHWPANVFRVDFAGSACDNIGIPGNRWPVPAVGASVYFRLYAYPDNCGISTGPIHNVQSNIGAIAWTITEDSCSGTSVPIGFKSYLLGGGEQFVGANVPTRTPLRYEWSLTRVSTSRFTARVRVYNDVTGALIFDENTLRRSSNNQTLASFNAGGGFAYSNASQAFTEVMLGAQGPSASGAKSNAWTYAGLAVCSDWCGRN